MSRQIGIVPATAGFAKKNSEQIRQSLPRVNINARAVCPKIQQHTSREIIKNSNLNDKITENEHKLYLKQI
jgi:hypothetical protein